jgi:hypothetical protein
MDPFSVAGLVLSIVGLVTEILSQCCQMMEKFKSATSDFAEVIYEVENLKSVLKSIENSPKSLDSILDLNRECEHEHELLQVIREYCFIVHELYANVEKLCESDGSHGWSWRKKRLRWSLRTVFIGTIPTSSEWLPCKYCFGSVKALVYVILITI